MRGRKSQPLALAPGDLPILQEVARSRSLPLFQVRHAGIALAITEGRRIRQIAAQSRCDPSTAWRLRRRYEQGGLARSLADLPRCGSPPQISPLQRARIVALACPGPVAEGLHITHRSSGDLARRAVADRIVPATSPAMVRRILNEVDLPPHRARFWRTARPDERFKERAEEVLWCHANAARSARRGVWAVAVDEVPNFRVPERTPIRRATPGSIEQREFEYTRHGAVNRLLLLIVHAGRMELAVLGAKDAGNYIEQSRPSRRRHRGLKGIFLIRDGDPSRTAGDTAAYLRGGGDWWRPRFTPAHASWLNEAELLARAFGHRYLRRASPRGRVVSSSSITSAHLGRSPTGCAPTRSSGHGAITR